MAESVPFILAPAREILTELRFIHKSLLVPNRGDVMTLTEEQGHRNMFEQPHPNAQCTPSGWSVLP